MAGTTTRYSRLSRQAEGLEDQIVGLKQDLFQAQKIFLEYSRDREVEITGLRKDRSDALHAFVRIYYAHYHEGENREAVFRDAIHNLVDIVGDMTGTGWPTGFDREMTKVMLESEDKGGAHDRRRGHREDCDSADLSIGRGYRWLDAE
jgi:hypothetical protein